MRLRNEQGEDKAQWPPLWLAILFAVALSATALFVSL